MQTNYFLQFKSIINAEVGKNKTLLLHACCAPCFSASVLQVENVFKTSVFFYNPNITDFDEYTKRLCEQKRYLSEYHKDVDLIEKGWDCNKFLNTVKGMETAPEGGKRCFLCYRMRLEKTAEVCAELGFDYFATTLTLSPHKNATVLNDIGFEVAKKFGVKYLPTDFKKQNGYKTSVELSHERGLYRQNYCGCEFSKR